MLVTVLFIIANNPAALQLLNEQIHFGTSKQFCPNNLFGNTQQPKETNYC